jgi:hypothetical protein
VISVPAIVETITQAAITAIGVVAVGKLEVAQGDG